MKEVKAEIRDIKISIEKEEGILFEELELEELMALKKAVTLDTIDRINLEISKKALNKIEGVFNSYNLKYQMKKRYDGRTVAIDVKDEELDKINLQELSDEMLILIMGCVLFGSNMKTQEELKRRNLIDENSNISRKFSGHFSLIL